MTSPEPWLTAAEAATILRTSGDMIHTMWRRGDFKPDHVFNLSTTDKPNLRICPAALSPLVEPAPAVVDTDEVTLARIRRLADNVQHELDALKRAALSNRLARKEV